MFNKDPDRSTGKTYRLALRVCLAASQCQIPVLVVAGNMDELNGLKSAIGRVMAGHPEVQDRVHFSLASADFKGLRGKYSFVFEDELLGMTWRQIKKYKAAMANIGTPFGENE